MANNPRSPAQQKRFASKWNMILDTLLAVGDLEESYKNNEPIEILSDKGNKFIHVVEYDEVAPRFRVLIKDA